MRANIMFMIFGAVVLLLMAIMIVTLFFPYLVDQQQSQYHSECISKYSNTTDPNISYSIGLQSCMIGLQYPTRLPNPQINITVKTIRFLWLGDCKIMTQKGEIYRASDDQICMAARPGDNLTVYQYRTRDNTITDYLVVG